MTTTTTTTNAPQYVVTSERGWLPLAAFVDPINAVAWARDNEPFRWFYQVLPIDHPSVVWSGKHRAAKARD